MRTYPGFFLLAASWHCVNSFHNIIRRYILSDTIKTIERATARRGDKLNDSPKSSITSSTIEKMLKAARRLRSEVSSIEGSNNTLQVPKGDFSEFVTTTAIDLAAAKSAELKTAQFATVSAAISVANNSTPVHVDQDISLNITTAELLEVRTVKPSLWDTAKRLFEIEQLEIDQEEEEADEEEEDDDDDLEIIIRVLPRQGNAEELLYSKENFTFAALPQYVQEDWKRISVYNSLSEIETAFKQMIGNPITNFIYEWFNKEIVKSFSNPAALDEAYLKIAVKAEMQSILLQLETEGGNANWDFSSLQGFSGDGIMLFYALLKSSYDSSGMKLTTPIASEMSNPVLNFNDLAAFGGIVVPEKKAEKKAAVEPPPTPIVAVTSAEKLLPAESAVNATDMNQVDFFDILKLIASDSTSDREFFSNLTKIFDVPEMEMGSTAEILISQYFDEESRTAGMTVSKAGAALFQKDVLRDCLVVSNVKMSQGAVVFEGSLSAGCKIEELAKKLEQKFIQSGLDNTFKYIIIKNEKILSLENGISELVMESLQGSIPSVILFPATWNATLLLNKNDPLRNAFRQIIGSLSVTSTVTMAATCFGLFSENSPFIETGALPEDFWPMILAAMSIQYGGVIVESIVAKLKGLCVDVSNVLLPSYNILFNYGPRSLYLNMPKNRNEIFDISFSGIVTTLGLSMAAIFTGLKYTADATQATINTFPTVPIAMLKVNSIMAQLLSNSFPALAAAISSSVAVNPNLDSISGGGGVDATLVHLHWLVIVGVMSFVSSVLQLIPLDNSAGSKLTGAALGRDLQTIVSSSFIVLKITLFVLVFFNFGGVSTTAVINKPKLLFDYFLISQIMGSERDGQLAVDSLSEISDGRKNIFYAFVFLLTMSFFPYLEYATSINLIVDGSIGYLRDLFSSGSAAIPRSF